MSPAHTPPLTAIFPERLKAGLGLVNARLPDLFHRRADLVKGLLALLDHGGDRKSKLHDATNSLSDIGVEKTRSSRAARRGGELLKGMGFGDHGGDRKSRPTMGLMS